MDDASAPAMYESFARHFAEHARDGSYNAHYERPAMLDLIGSVEGLDVLDAGCGPGFYAQELVAGGARVTAIDASPAMVAMTQESVGSRAAVLVANLEVPLAWLPDASQDLVVMALVLHHVDNRSGLLNEFRRTLRPGGHVVLSTVHPMADWLRLGGSYFERVAVEEEWNDGWPVRFWRQPLEAWCAEFTDAGFLIERIVEPRPAESMRSADPHTYAKLIDRPEFILFRLQSP